MASDDAVEIARLPAHDVEDRAETSWSRIGLRPFSVDDAGRRRSPPLAGASPPGDASSSLAHRVDMAVERCLGGGVDDRADMGIDRAGSPSFSSRAAPAIISIILSATSSCTQSRRSAEQRWPAERKADITTSSATCSGSAVASTIMALMPPVSAMSGTIGPSFAASARLIARHGRSSR
jgi:hypothetical protein